MRIPNKFNGYSRDGIRLYNDPTMVVATIGSMDEAATTAETMAALSSTAETTAAAAAAQQAAEEAARQAAAQQAGQAGIMQGGTGVPPAPGTPGLGAPVPPAEPLPPAGLTLGQQNFLKSSVSDLSGNSMPTETYNGGISPAGQSTITPADANLPGPGGQNLMSDAEKAEMLKGSTQPYVDQTAKPFFGDNALGRGISQAMDLIDKGYEGFEKAPLPLQALGTMATYQKIFQQPQNPKPKKYQHQDMSQFQPTVPVQQNLNRSYEWQGYAVGGPVEQMSAINSTSGNMMYPQAGIQSSMYSNPMVQRPMATNVIDQGVDTNVDPYTGEEKFSDGGYAEDKEAAEQAAQRKQYSQMMGDRSSDVESDIAKGQAIASRAKGSSAGIVPFEKTQKSAYGAAVDRYQNLAKKAGVPGINMPKTNLGNINNYVNTMGSTAVEEAASGGIMHGLGGYSDGGRLLKGPGDGVSDSIPAVIGSKQPARLADGEFVVPARIVSELGNGSTEAGARKLYAMMERVQSARKKSVGKNKVAVNSKADKLLPA